MGAAESTRAGRAEGACACTGDGMLGAAPFLTNSAEVVLRGFLIGFSVRMIKALYRDDFKLSSAQGRAAAENAVLMGLATSCFLLGISVLVPKPLQDFWMSG